MANIICIDPGHGGKDPGGGSNKHFKEKDMVLQISNEQKKHFVRNGIKVVMTRTSDEYLDSVPRTNRVKASGAKYCISNHINAGGGEGAETIHSIHSSSNISTGILNALVAAGAKKRRVFSLRGTNGDYYYMHRMTGAVDTIIVEYGFADNSSDTQKIISDWKKYAEAVARYYIEKVFKKEYIPESKKEENKSEKPAAKQENKPAANTGGVHVVRSGEVLSKIAAKYKTTVKALQDLNGIKNPNLIRVGQKIKLPGSAPAKAPTQKAVYHTVKRGETVSGLAVKYKVTKAQIKNWNNLKDINKIIVGQKLRVK